MKNLSLWFFSVFFSFVSLSVYSRGLPDHLQQDAEFLMKTLEKGNMDAYSEKKGNINYRDMRKVFQFINSNGDNILHFLVRLEQSEGLSKRYNLDRLLIEEIKYAFDVLSSWNFLWFLTQGNKQGISPLQEAAFSQHLSKSPDNWRDKLSKHLSENTISKLLSASVPDQNRGLAYKALQMAVGSYSWPWRTAFDALFFVVTPAGAALGASITGDGALAGGIGGSIALFSCYVIFKRLSNLSKAKKLLSAP